MFKILYLEDDINLSDTICEYLEDNNFTIIPSYNSKDALEKLYTDKFDLFILDVKLPDINGFDLLKTLRDANIQLPTIFTTTLNDIESLDKGYQVGADDYLRKPFDLKELLHRINILLKRNFNIKEYKMQLSSNIVFDFSSNLLYKNNNIVKLSNKETRLLKLFIKYSNSVILLEQIYDYVWNSDEIHSEGSLRTYIKNLRKIFGKDTIISIKKQGYKFVV